MRRFLLKTLLFSLPILGVIGYYTCRIQPRLRSTGPGDIGRMSLLFFPADYTLPKPILDKPIHNLAFTDTISNTDSCILVIGDSFSQFDDYPYKYINFLAQYASVPVYKRARKHADNPFHRFIYRSKVQQLPSIVIIETVERYMLWRLEQTQFQKSVDSLFIEYVDTIAKSGKHFGDKTILEQTQEFVKKRVGIENPVHNVHLNTPLFTCRGHEQELYFIEEDLQKYDAERIDLAVRKLDSLFAYAKEVGVHLYVVVAEDKYDLYQPYIADNPYPPSVNLDSLAARYRSPYFINSKDTLAPMAARGVKDIFFCDDTHWSQVGGKAVAEQVAKRIMAQEGDSTLFLLP